MPAPQEVAPSEAPAARWRVWIGPALLLLLGLALRLSLWRMPMYGDEAVLYYFSRHPLQDVANLHVLGTSEGYGAAYYFWWRPLFRVFLIPGALVSFDAYRFLYILTASLLAPATTLTLRAYHVRPVLAYGAGVAAAASPVLVLWGAVTFPDVPMALAFTLGLWAYALEKHRATALAFTAAIWLKETAVIGVLPLLGLSLWNDWRARELGVWPLRMRERSTGLLVSVILGVAPLFFYLNAGGRSPGWTPGGNGWGFLDHILPVIWLLPLLVLGLAWRRTRVIAGLSLLFPAFYLFYSQVLGRGVEFWYVAHPHLLALMAAALVLDEALVRSQGRQRPRASVWGVAGLLAVLLVAHIALPASSDLKAAVFSPISGSPIDGTPRTIAHEQGRPAYLEDVAAQLRPTDWRSVLLIDLGWFFTFYPFAERADTAYFAYTSWYLHEGWAQAIENDTEATVVYTEAPVRPLNQAIRNVYADCVAYENAAYVLIRGPECPGRAEALAEENKRLQAEQDASA